jgi:hypothetical protein
MAVISFMSRSFLVSEEGAAPRRRDQGNQNDLLSETTAAVLPAGLVKPLPPV